MSWLWGIQSYLICNIQCGIFVEVRHAQKTNIKEQGSSNTEKIGFYLWLSGSLLSGFWFNFHYWECSAHQMILIISSRQENNIHKENIYHFARLRPPLHVTVPVMSVTPDWKQKFQYLVIDNALVNTSEYSPLFWWICVLSYMLELFCSCSVAKSCRTLCDPMDYSTPGFPVLHDLPEFAKIH